MPRLSDLVNRNHPNGVNPNSLAGLSRDQMAVQEVMREVERRNAELQSGAPQRRSFGISGTEGQLFDEMDYQAKLSGMNQDRPPSVINYNPNAQQQRPQNYMQIGDGERIDLGQSAKEMQVFGLPALMDEKRGMVTIYHPSGRQEHTHINDIRAEEERRRQQAEMADLPRRMALAKLKEQEAKAQGGGLSPADQLAREKFDWLKAKGGKPKGQALSAAGQKELFESDEFIQSGQNAIGMLNQALDLNKKAYSGAFAKERAVARSQFGEDPQATATIDLDNIMTSQALESLKSIFGGMPTEGERKILMDIQASADKTPNQREIIIKRAIDAAGKRMEFNKSKAGALRSGTYFTEGVQQGQQDDDITDLLNKYQ